MNFDETQALDSSNYDESDEEQEFERNRKLVGHLKVFKQLDLEEKVYKIYEGENFIGRDEGSDVYIPRKSLSKSHACIEVSDSLHLIYDNSSKNKTRRDKVALKPQVRYELKTGDMLTVADLRLQYFIGDVPQLDDDNDDTGSETGSESMLPIDATTTDVTANETKENVSKVYATDTDSDTDDEKPSKLDKSKAQTSKDDNQESKPQVPKVMYDSYDEDEEIITKKPHDVIPHKGEDSALDVSSEGGTLAFGLVSPTDERPFIRPTPKQAVKETPATLLYTQNEATSSQKDGMPSTLLYASQTQDGSTRNLSPKSFNKQIENAPATLLYSTQTQDKSLASETSDVSPEKPLGNTPATLLYSAQTQDRSLSSETSEVSPEKAVVDTPATLLYNTDIQDNVGSNSKSHESSSSSAEIFEPETQGFSPKETSFCLPTQSYIKETPADTEEKGLQISNIPESDDEENKDGVKRNLSFDESATQAYTWNDSDATDDEDDDLRFQPTQAYPANMKSTENNEDSTDDEQSNPDLYATTNPAEDTVADSSDEEKQIKETSVEPTMPYGIDDMETQAYEVEDKDVLTRMGDSESTDVKNGKQRAHDHSESETAESDKINKGPKGHRKGRVQFTKDLQPTLPYSMQETQAYEADENIIEEETDKDFEKPSVSDNKVTQNVDNMMETQAYDAFEETGSNLQPTLPYSMMETQAYDADEDTTEGEKMFKKPIVKGGKVTEVVEQTFPYSMMETQAYDAETEEDSPDKHQHKASTETANLPVVVEPTLPYDVTDTDDLERGNAEDAVIQQTQAYGVGDDSETDDETLDSNAAGPSGIHESEKEKIESKESEAIQDTYEATQAYGLDSQMNEVVPDRGDVSSRGIPTPKATKSKSDKNNNTTNNMSDNQENPQEVCEIIIRPVRRGRGRVTQGDDDHPVATKTVDVIPKSSRGRRSRKSTKEDTTLENDVKTVKARKSARNEDKSLDNEDITTRSVAKSPQSRRSARKEEKSPENEDLSTRVTKASKSRRSARKEDNPLDNEDMADNVPEAPKSRRSARKEDKPLDNEDMADSVPEAPKSRRSARKEDKPLENEDMADSVAKAPKSRRSARKENKHLDNEDMADSVTKAPKSRRSARKEDKPLDNEDVSENVPEAPMLSQGTRRASGRTRKTAVKTNQDSPKPQLKERVPKTEEEKTHKSEKGKSQEEYADSLEMKDSEEEFMFKGKGKGKRKGKQPAKKHLQVADDDLSEKDSEDLPPLDAILSEKKQEKDQFKKEVKEEQVSSSPGSTPRRKRGKTKTDDETPSKKQKEDNDDTPKQRSSIRERRQPMPRIMFTGVIDKEAEKIVTSLGGTMEESIHNCTHLITDKVRRTVKFLCGLASGCIIALPTWLTASKKSKKFIDHEPYFVQDKAAEKMYSFSLQLSHEQALKKGLLEGYKVHVTKNVKPEPQQMKDIIQCAKGEFLTRMPRTKEDNILVISCDADNDACKPALASGIPVYSAELLLTGILRQDLSLDQNLLFVENEGKTPTSGSTTRKRRNESSVSESSQSSSRSSKHKKK